MSAERLIDNYLAQTSRTYAITIPLLDNPARLEVGMSYLLLRIVDTFEDATLWKKEKKIEVIKKYIDLLITRDKTICNEIISICKNDPPVENKSYIELILNLEKIIEILNSFEMGKNEIITHHVVRISRGMKDTLEHYGTDDNFLLNDFNQLILYCYIVAGIVAELYTDLFLYNYPRLFPMLYELKSVAPHIGEALQLTNILKDYSVDKIEHRTYIAHPEEKIIIIEKIQNDYQKTKYYIDLLIGRNCPASIINFVAFPILLSIETVKILCKEGDSNKISRNEVAAILDKMKTDTSVNINPLNRYIEVK